MWTAQDELERLLVTQELTNQGRQRQLARTAILTILRDIPNRTRWTYFTRRFTLRTTAAQTGTLTFDYTGGAVERLATVSGITLPTDGTGSQFRILVGHVHYDIERVLTSTTCQLNANNTPSSDITAGTSCQVYRLLHSFPSDFRKLVTVWDVENEELIPVIQEDEWHLQTVTFYDVPDVPEWCAVTNQGDVLNGLLLALSPPPLGNRNYDIMYEATTRPIRTWKYAEGTFTSDGTAVVAIDTGEPSVNHVGAVIRFSDSSSMEPTPLVGDMTGLDNPYLYERVIVAQTSSTYTLNDTVPALTAKKYVVSDPIDIESGAMLTAFQRMCDAEYSQLLRNDDWSVRQQVANQALRLAMESDQRTTYSKRNEPYYDRFRRARINTDA
jgi:hypothetical protein